MLGVLHYILSVTIECIVYAGVAALHFECCTRLHQYIGALHKSVELDCNIALGCWITL